ncbi:E3 ubiquitin-protein ligase HUWE1 [Mustela nigripes]|uniref:E3 ubiquitin-protein ligase HUWE1 n=1 Tax=Mustela nigripes TaxID=77151 RepID=UPI0028160578|nr:E3 ubiquitin-protein ligase HUWE1 [Mustela nigripes]
MKVDRTKLKKTPTEAPADCRALIDKLKVCNDEQLLLELQQIKTWNIGKCELYHWVDLLDRFDGILADAGQTVENMSWMLVCDRPEREQLKMLLLAVLNFTALLIEYSFSRHLYSSIEHLTTLLASSDMQVVLAVLNLLYVFSKRSNYITRLGSDKRTPLLTRLQHLAESWGGKENGFGLAECCRDLHMMKYPPSATTLHFEFYADPGAEVKIEKRTTSNTLHYIHIEQLDKISESPSEIMESLTKMYSIPKDKQMLLFTHIRLAHGFSNHRKRLQAVQARLHAISILVYSNALQESANSILYNGLIEELVDVLQITDKQLMEIKAASLRTLTSIVHLERTPKLSSIIDCTGTASYHGFLPVLVRNCIQAMIDPSMDPYPHQFATALFSFLYHLASYDAGGEALVSCGMMEALLKVIKFLGDEQDQITFVTRAVRVVDLITNLDMAAFQSHSGLSIFIYRLEHEVDLCRKECPFVIKPKIQRPSTTQEGEEMETDMDVTDVTMESSPGSSISVEHRLDVELRASSSSSSTSISSGSGPGPRPGVQCIPQRAALLKSMLNFLKKAIQDPAFSDGIRHVMDGSLPTSLKHIISNAEYYGPSLFLLATEVVTVFVFQEPSLLSSLQDNGLTDVMLHALLIKDVPATREVLGSLPNVFSALCLNARGLQSFVQCQPFERLFKVLLSPDYLPAMRRRRSSDPLGDTASNLGSAVDELMRHQPTLKTDATTAIIKLLEEICNLGRDPKYICQKPSIQKADGTATAPPPRSNHAAEEASSEDEEEEEVQAMQSFNSTQQNETEPNQQVVGTEERIPIPLMDYILNVMKFVESILSNNTTDDHCQEFVNQKGLLPLVTILGLPNLPIDFPTSAACQAVAGVCKSILTLSHEPKVLQEGLLQLDSILSSLEPLHRPIESPGGSVLLRELACAGNVADATLSAQATPLLHALTAAHAYIMMFVHTCRVGQSEIRSISVNQWGSQLGLSVLSKLSQLYCSLVWESTVLLSLCTPNSLPSGCEFGQADMQKLVPKDEKAGTTQGGKRSDGEQDGTAASMDASTQGLLEGIGLDGDTLAPMETDEPTASDSKGKSKITPAMAARIKQIKPLLSASSRLGRALAELFGLLVKLCVGSPVRQRRSHHAASTTTAPTPAARSTASALTKLLTKGLSWQPPPYTPTPRFRLTFFICSVGFTSPMLFDERKYPYHLMLQKFLCSGGHNALFETFNWALSMGGKVPVAEGLEHSDLPDGTGEFLDAWLMLVEKMVNPTTVLESPHSLPAKLPGGVQNFPQFSALRFLVVTQKAAFTCIKNLWNRKPLKVYGGRMAESMLAILCHILRGEPVIREKLSKEKEGSRGEEDTGQEEGGSRREPQVNQQQLQQLMDMGFTREHAMEALLNTSTMEQATEYLLTHPPPIMGGVVRDLSMSEEDQMMRAIAMSLGQDIPMDQRAESPEEVACRKEEEERKAREKQEEEEAKCLEKFQDADPLEQDELHTFTDTMLPGCFHLLDELPDTVYRVCDLIMTAIKRNGADYRDMILKQVVNQVWEAADVLIKAALPLTTSDTKTVSEWISQMATLPQASNLATRILLLTLLFEELKLPCAWVVESSGILNVLIKLLEVVQPCLQAAKEQKEVQTPKWITPVLLLIDFYEKTAISSKRRAQMTKYLQSNNNNWRWFDDRSGRWCSYSASNNSTIDSAWKSGETSVRFTAGRRRYTVQFTTMVQVNEETGNRRPVMLTLLRVPRLNKNSKNSNGQELEKTLEESKEMDIKRKENKANDTPLALEGTNTEKETSLEETKIGEILIQGLTEDMVTVLIRACVSMLGVPVDPDTLHATLRLCLRLTRDHKYAMMFAELKSTRMILNLTQSSGFNGFTPLVTLLLRHIIEDPCTLRHTMEKVVRSAATSGAGSTTSGVVSGSLGSREINYILRVLGPAACRNPDIFTEVANCCIRIALPAPRGSGTASDDEFENLRIKGPNAVQLVKTTPLKPSPLPVIPDTIKEVIYDMLNALAAYHAPEEAEKSDPKPGGMTQEVGQLLQDMGDDVYQQYRSLTRQSSDFDTQSGFSINSQVFAADGASTETSTSGTSQGEASTPEESRDGKKDKEGDRASEEGKQKGKGSKPLMPTSTILRLLAELVRSYVGIATLIANYSYTVGQSELIKEDCSVLAFVLDHLLPHTQNAEDKDTPALARLFLASLAAAGSGTDAQVALVNEVKAALGRALAMAESTEKHARLQAVMCIISTIMESCPSTSSFYSSATAKTQHNGMNNIIRLFLKKGLVNDLARVPHSLDLSSAQLLMPVESEELGPTRPSGEAETTQMELSPAPTITSLSPERAEDSDALTAVSSQLEGSPMDTSSLASCTLEEAVGDTSAAGSSEQPTAGSSTPGDAPPVVTEVQGRGDTSGEPTQPPEDSSPPASSESSSTRDSAVAISGADSRGILEEPLPSTSSEEEDPLAGISLPEGVDPSFLAALPDDIRREVLQNQLGIRPPTRTAPSANSSAPAVVGNPGVTEVSPEFLAALPPAIQEEVLAQQRAEQQRRELAQNASSDTPMDPVTFIQTLPSDLRRSVLEDMEDSVLAVMPPDIAAEAQALRREQEARQRQLMHERLFGHSSTSALSAILRSPAFTSRLSGNRGVQYTRLAVQRGGTFQMGGSSSHNRPSGSNVDTLLRLRGRLLLDHEALSCLLVLLFVDEPKLNTSRLHRVLRNLCYHAQTRHWVIRSLLSILQRSSESELCIETPKLSSSEEKGKKSSKSCGSSSHENRPLDLLHKMESKSSNQLSWLSVSMDAALGCRTNIFQIQRSGGRKHTEKHASSGSTVHIHPQAAPVVCRHVLDTLIQLAKVFPSHFTQQRTKETNCESDRERGSNKQACSPCSSQSTSSGICTDFWDLLVKLDNMNVSRKGKNSVKSVPVSAGGEGETSPYSLEASPLGQLMNMLSHPVIRRSSLLTEKLLRLLSLISIALPENKVSETQANSGSSASSTTVATSTTSTTTTTAASSTPTPPAATTPVTSAPALVAATAVSTIAVAASTTVTTPTTATTTVSTSTTTKVSKSPAKMGDGGSSSADFKMVSSGLTENQLQLSVEVLTSHSCSEEGLEDAANVLLQLSRGDPATRDTVLKLLLNGARHLGYTLCKQIGTLLAELREYNLEQQRRAQCETLSPDGLPEEQPQTTKLKGKMQSRFDMAENVVIVASQKRPLGGRELQLPSMSMLTSKTSTQKFFLRVLQVIIQLRDDTRRANKKAKQTGRLGSSGLGSASSIQAAVRQLEAEADAIIQMVREGQRARRQQQAATSESSQSEASVRREESPMDVDQPSPSAQDTQSIGSDGTPQGEKEKEERPPELPLLSEQLSLDELWDMLGECLKELEESHDQHAVLVLQPAVEAFFLVHATERESKPPIRDTRESQLAHIKDEPPPLSPAPLTPATPSSLDPFFSREPSSMHISSSLPPDTQKFLRFAETHRTVLNQILRQSTTHLADGPFAVLVDYIRVLDFDVKRKYFRQELERLDEGLRKEDMAVHVRRDHVFEDSYRELHRKSPEEMKNRLYIVFEGEEGQDAGGLLREWYMIISREMFNPMYALFRTSPGDRVTYTINPSSHCNPNHLSYFKFVGRIVAKAVYDNRLLECYFTRSFYKHILGKSVRYTDMESEDYHFYQGLVYLLENDVSTLGYDLTFSTEVQEFGVCEVRDLKPNGANILVTEENKKEYVHLVCQMRMTGAIRKQLAAFLEGFYEIIPKRLISIFTEQELELLISGLPTIDIDDLKSNTEYHKYQSNSIQIQWFWRALRSFDQADRAKFLQFVTGTSKVPLQGFAALEGMNGIQKFQIHRDDRSTDRLPSAHTCFNQLDLPAYESFEKLRHMLLLAIQECSEGFGLA